MIRTLSRDVQIFVSLSKLVPNKRNPRRVKPQREAHRQMVASIRAHGLLQPLVVRAHDAGLYKIIAGDRRLAGLREAYKGAAHSPKVPCILRAVDDDTADALALAENFVREPMHPLDEAEAFARLAREQAKGVEAIAAAFGVGQPYVRQRMKLATLAEPIKTAYRQSTIDTATAEAFASVPPDRQVEVWQDVKGNPHHAEHVRNVIAHAWIDASTALFDLSALPESAVSKDLFDDKVRVERKAFMECQAAALLAQRELLVEDGWADVVVGPRGDVQDRLWSMDEAPQAYDEETTAKLAKLSDKRDKLEAKFGELTEESDPDSSKSEALTAKLEALDAEETELVQTAEKHYAEATKAVGSVFLILDPDGRTRQEYRIPRPRSRVSGNGSAAGGGSSAAGGDSIEAPQPPGPDDLKEPQLATTFTHQALCVREALLKNTAARKRVLALILHDKVRTEALAIGREANGTTLHADHHPEFSSAAMDAVRQRRAEVDPLHDQYSVQDGHAYVLLAGLPDKQISALIDVLTVECVTAHLQRRTDLVWRLAGELGVDVRKVWRPDERWLSSYQKIQLAALLVELRGPAHAPAPSTTKSELVMTLAKLFTEAAEGRIENAALAEKLNHWLPSNLQAAQPVDAMEQASAA